MLTVIYVIFIIILFSLLVIIHEWGHFIMARRDGVEVEEFGIGFPPYLWGKVVKGTLYSINWLPLGGFVRLKGEDNSEKGPGTFGAAKYWTKFRILMAGVFLNLLTAIVIFYALCVTNLPALGPQFEPSFLHPMYTQPKQLLVLSVAPQSPGAIAGIKKDDYILQADGQALTGADQLIEFTKGHAGQEVVFRVKTGESERDVPVKLRPAGSKNGYLGVGAGLTYALKYSPLEAVPAAIYITLALLWATIVGVLNLLINVPLLIVSLFSNTIPTAAETASGPIGIFKMFSQIKDLGMSYVFLLVGNIAVALAAFNALPLPALDGGRLALITWQKVTKRKISSETEMKIHTYGFMALMGLMLLLSVYDLKK